MEDSTVQIVNEEQSDLLKKTNSSKSLKEVPEVDDRNNEQMSRKRQLETDPVDSSEDDPTKRIKHLNTDVNTCDYIQCMEEAIVKTPLDIKMAEKVRKMTGYVPPEMYKIDSAHKARAHMARAQMARAHMSYNPYLRRRRTLSRKIKPWFDLLKSSSYETAKKINFTEASGIVIEQLARHIWMKLLVYNDNDSDLMNCVALAKHIQDEFGLFTFGKKVDFKQAFSDAATEIFEARCNQFGLCTPELYESTTEQKSNQFTVLQRVSRFCGELYNIDLLPLSAIKWFILRLQITAPNIEQFAVLPCNENMDASNLPAVNEKQFEFFEKAISPSNSDKVQQVDDKENELSPVSRKRQLEADQVNTPVDDPTKKIKHLNSGVDMFALRSQRKQQYAEPLNITMAAIFGDEGPISPGKPKVLSVDNVPTIEEKKIGNGQESKHIDTYEDLKKKHEVLRRRAKPSFDTFDRDIQYLRTTQSAAAKTETMPQLSAHQKRELERIRQKVDDDKMEKVAEFCKKGKCWQKSQHENYSNFILKNNISLWFDWLKASNYQVAKSINFTQASEVVIEQLARHIWMKLLIYDDNASELMDLVSLAQDIHEKFGISLGKKADFKQAFSSAACEIFESKCSAFKLHTPNFHDPADEQFAVLFPMLSIVSRFCSELYNADLLPLSAIKWFILRLQVTTPNVEQFAIRPCNEAAIELALLVVGVIQDKLCDEDTEYLFWVTEAINNISKYFAENKLNENEINKTEENINIPQIASPEKVGSSDVSGFNPVDSTDATVSENSKPSVAKEDTDQQGGVPVFVLKEAEEMCLMQ